MHLPHELVVLVTQRLGRRDLKSARLVSKLWCSCASESLFTTIHVSANKVDLDAFTAITNDPVLSKCVRRLVYDGSEFRLNYSKTKYLDKLRSQTSSAFHQHKSRHSEYQDQEFRDLMTEHRPEFEAAKQRLGDSKLVTEGYKKYHEHAVYQRDSLRSGSFFNGLAQGLRKLPLLSSIDVRRRWPPASRIDQGFGSLLARKWNPFHVYPASWYLVQDSSFVGAECNGKEHYFIIVSALVRAQRKIRNFFICVIPPEIFDRSDHTKPSVLGLDTVAFAGLEKLGLSLASWCAGAIDQGTTEIRPNLDGLRIMLSSMTRLKDLALILPSGGRYGCDQVFPKDTIWTQLETLELFGLSSKAPDLLDLVTFQMPKLQNLTIGLIILSDGIWEGVIECLKRYSKLSNLGIDRLYENSGREFRGVFFYPHDDERLHMSWLREFSHYVVHGGRHPSLTPDQPDSAAEDFAKDLKPLLRCCTSSQPNRTAHTF